MATWDLRLRDRTGGGGLVVNDVPFRSLTAKWVLNGPGSIEIDLRHDVDLGGARAGQAELQLRRDGVVVWAGPWLGTDVDARARSIKLNGEGLWWWFRRRIVTTDLLFTADPQHEIAWDLLDHTQGQTHGSLGIVQGTHTGTSKVRDRFYCAANTPNIAEEVEAFTAYETGLDFAIDPATREFDTWCPSRMADSGVTLDENSVDVLTWLEDVREVRNYVTGVGANECGSILVTASDATLANTYGRLHEGFDTDDDDDTGGEVTEATNEELRAHKRPRFDALVYFREDGTGAPAWADLVVGNTLELSDSRGYSTFTKDLRMTALSVNLDNGLPGEPVFGLELSAAVAA